ncbi:MAG: ribonuclease D [bacterium]
MLISTTQQLSEFCKCITGSELICIDTEFIREDSYLPRLETIQIRAGEEIAIIDFPVIKDLSELWRILYTPGVTKAFHACQQDLELLYQASGQVMCDVFDTQVASAVVGYGEQIGYGQLVKQITGVALSKSQSYTAWGVRPLTQAQIDYAMDDVRYMPALVEHLRERLETLGRLDWAKGEFSTLEQAVLEEPTPLSELYLRVRNMDNLERRELAILRELTCWREEEALYRNKLPQRLLRDELLVSLSRRPPESVGELRRMRGFPPFEADRLGSEIIAAVKKALAVPPEQWPEKPKSRSIDPATQAVMALVQAFIRGRAVDEQVAWGLLCNSANLEEIVSKRKTIKAGDTHILSGWRYELVGKDLLRLLNGDLALSFDPETGRVRVQ